MIVDGSVMGVRPREAMTLRVSEGRHGWYCIAYTGDGSKPGSAMAGAGSFDSVREAFEYLLDDLGDEITVVLPWVRDSDDSLRELWTPATAEADSSHELFEWDDGTGKYAYAMVVAESGRPPTIDADLDDLCTISADDARRLAAMLSDAADACDRKATAA